MEVQDESGERGERMARLSAHKILDGCAVMSFLEYPLGSTIHKEFRLHTFNTYADAFEENLLDNRPGTGLVVAFGERDGEAVRLSTRAGAEVSSEIVWAFGDEVLGFEETRTDGTGGPAPATTRQFPSLRIGDRPGRGRCGAPAYNIHLLQVGLCRVLHSLGEGSGGRRWPAPCSVRSPW